jgi:hypothetical protein
LVTAGKHVNNTRAIARQLLGTRVLAITDTHATLEVLSNYNNGNGVFYVVRAEIFQVDSADIRGLRGTCIVTPLIVTISQNDMAILKQKHLRESRPHSLTYGAVPFLRSRQLCFLTFYGTRRFITVFTRALNWSLS